MPAFLTNGAGDKDIVQITEELTDRFAALGKGFESRLRWAFTATQTRYFVLDMSALPASQRIAILPIGVSATSGPVSIDTFTITSYTGGTTVTCTKLNTFKSVAQKGVLKVDATVVDTTTGLRQYTLGATGNPQQVARAGSTAGAEPLIVPGGTIIAMKVVGAATAAFSLDFGLVWYEDI